MFDTKNDNMTEMIRAGMDITNVALGMERRYEKEVASMMKEIDSLCHQEEYYQNST